MNLSGDLIVSGSAWSVLEIDLPNALSHNWVAVPRDPGAAHLAEPGGPRGPRCADCGFDLAVLATNGSDTITTCPAATAQLAASLREEIKALRGDCASRNGRVHVALHAEYWDLRFYNRFGGVTVRGSETYPVTVAKVADLCSRAVGWNETGRRRSEPPVQKTAPVLARESVRQVRAAAKLVAIRTGVRFDEQQGDPLTLSLEDYWFVLRYSDRTLRVRPEEFAQPSAILFSAVLITPDRVRGAVFHFSPGASINECWLDERGNRHSDNDLAGRLVSLVIRGD